VKVINLNNPGSKFEGQEPWIFSVRAQLVIR